jgi:hypothetical protein
MIDLKSYFHDKYQGGESFIENVILPIFGEDKYEDAYEEDVLENNPELITMADTIGISQILRLGTINIPMNPTDVFDITVSNHVQMERNRVTIQQLVRRIMSTYSSAFMVFHYDDDERWDWRFTFCSKQGNNQETTDSKRYTFLLGPNQSCRTAAENFNKLASKHGEIELDDIVKAFDVESLSKEFFEKYKVHYGRFVGHVIGKEYVDKGDGKGEWREKEGLNPSELFYGLHEDEKMVRDYVKKLLGRIVFLHFLQKKGWLGATDEEWTNGPQDFMYQLFENASADQQENFLDDILEPLFSCLDTPLNQRREVFDTKVDGLRSVRVPFLGGLFERTEEDKAISIFPSGLFSDFFKFLSEYNFTIDENDPNDAQVGVDPEMLGRIFENLLEDNKDKGAFYTPKEIVHYMCRESLISYLQTDVTDIPTREALRQFVTSHDVALLGGRDSALAQNVSQCLKDVKICDPAIGSGAFPMGLLNELFLCRGVIEDFSNAAVIKRHIIEQNIFGVDIEKGAVEIARLRFWLSLITDADKPDVLPNMDFKIMQGNSLLEQYKGFDLSNIMDAKTEILGGFQFNMFETQIDVIRAEVKETIKLYFSEQNHDVRRAMRESIQQKIQQQIAVQGINVDISDIKDIAANDQFFLWHTWFSEVFAKNGGFDIVIGNPPYITMTKNNTNSNVLKSYIDGFVSIKKCYSKNIYTLFIELGVIKLLKSKGIISYIIPEGLFKTRSYEDCVSMMYANGDVLFYSTFDSYVFDNAVTGSLIFNYRKELQGVQPIHFAFDSNYNISIVPEEDASIFDKISNNTKELKEIAELFKGMVVKDRQSVVFDTLDNNPDIFLLGKSIVKWTVKTPFFTDYNNLTIIGGTKKKAKHDVAPRIVIRRTGDTLCCSMLEKAALTESTLYSCWSKDKTIDNKYLIAVLNSSLLDFYNKKKNITNQQGFPQILMTDLQELPIKVVEKYQQQPIITLVDRILSAKKNDPQADTATLEAEIDRLVYDLYGLTEDEIKIVEENI